jgi:hypothetical protein
MQVLLLLQQQPFRVWGRAWGCGYLQRDDLLPQELGPGFARLPLGNAKDPGRQAGLLRLEAFRLLPDDQHDSITDFFYQLWFVQAALQKAVQVGHIPTIEGLERLGLTRHHLT